MNDLFTPRPLVPTVRGLDDETLAQLQGWADDSVMYLADRDTELGLFFADLARWVGEIATYEMNTRIVVESQSL